MRETVHKRHFPHRNQRVADLQCRLGHMRFCSCSKCTFSTKRNKYHVPLDMPSCDSGLRAWGLLLFCRQMTVCMHREVRVISPLETGARCGKVVCSHQLCLCSCSAQFFTWGTRTQRELAKCTLGAAITREIRQHKGFLSANPGVFSRVSCRLSKCYETNQGHKRPTKFQPLFVFLQQYFGLINVFEQIIRLCHGQDKEVEPAPRQPLAQTLQVGVRHRNLSLGCSRCADKPAK